MKTTMKQILETLGKNRNTVHDTCKPSGGGGGGAALLGGGRAGGVIENSTMSDIYVKLTDVKIAFAKNTVLCKSDLIIIENDFLGDLEDLPTINL